MRLAAVTAGVAALAALGATALFGGCNRSDHGSDSTKDLIAYICGETDTICLVESTGQGYRGLADSHPAADPGWSPEGNVIAFASLGTRSVEGAHWIGGDDLYLIGTDGSDLRRLTSGDSFDSSPTFSGDGRSIAFASDRELVRTSGTTGASGSIYRIDVGGRSITRLTDGPFDSDPSWSWASDRVAYVRRNEIWVLDADGNQRRLISFPGRFASAPAWSSDGTKLAFELDGRIYTAGSNGQRPTPLTTSDQTAEEQDPTWSSDGKRIAFSAIDTSADVECRAIFVVNAINRTLERITDCDEPGQRLALSPAWRPNAP